MEEKMDKAAAKMLAAEILKRQIYKDFLDREETLDRETLKNMREKWFEVLIKSKLPEMKENLRSVLDYMEKLVELEVFRKRLFEEERIELTDQLNIQAQSHSRAVDKLYGLYLQVMNDLHEFYNQQILQKKQEADKELQKISERQEKTEEDMKTILYQMAITQDRQEDSMKCEMFLKTDDEKSKNTEKNENLRAKLERLIEKKWYQISSTLADYQQSTETRKKHYAQLKVRDRHDSKIIHSQMRKIQKLYEQIQKLKNYLENPDLDNEKVEELSDCKEERAKFYNSFVYLKKIMALEMRTDDANLRELTALSKNTIDYLNSFFKKGHRILLLFSLCLKLETQKEKIVPVGGALYGSKIPDYIVERMKSSRIHGLTNSLDNEIIKSFRVEDFQKFWRKVGKVRLTMVALSRCIQDLHSENIALRKLLNSYLNQVSTTN